MVGEIPFHEGYALAFDEARRALDAQARTVADLRARSGALMTASAIATSFLGSVSLAGHGLAPAAWLAIGCFGLTGVCVLAILLPRDDLGTAVAARPLIETYIEPAAGVPAALHEIHREIALHLDHAAMRNRRQLQLLTTLLRAASALITCEVVAWVVALATTT